MSANTQILITKPQKTYIISLVDVDCGKGQIIGKTKTLEEAIDLANKYQEDNPFDVEYGLSIRIKQTN